MIQLALRSSIQAEPPAGSARSARIEGNATAVISSSIPARKTPSPMTASRTSREPRDMSASVSRYAVGSRRLPGPLRLVEHRRWDRDTDIVAAGDEDPAVVQERRGVATAGCAHR